MSRRRRRLSGVRHSRSKIRRAQRKGIGRAKKAMVRVWVMRDRQEYSTNYRAWACWQRRGGVMDTRSFCGDERSGKTPSIAARKALAALARIKR